jgi:WD40 repeat protein
MTPGELERAIVKPARKVGLDFEAGLVERLLNDVGDEPGNLPLLEFALTELWTERQSRSMTHAAYEKFGGLTKAISHTAHAELEKFTPEQQRTVRQILTRLVRVQTPGEGLEDARQRVFLNELGADARPIVDKLANARLLVTARDPGTGQDTVEVSHEALIPGWSDLRAWLNEDREFLLWRQRLKLYSTVWQHANRDVGGLLRGALLTEAERWQASHTTGLNDEERDFIGKSLERRSKEVLEEERRRRRRVTTLVVSLLLMAALASVAGLQWRLAVSQRRIADARTLLSPAMLITTADPSKFDQAALLAIESLRLDDTAEARSILSDAVRLLPQRTAQVEINCDGRIRISAGGSFLACLDSTNRSAKIISVLNGKDLPQSRITETREIATVDASPNGKFVGIGLRRGGFKLIDAESGRVVISENQGADATVAFSANGKLFAASVVDQATTTIHLMTISDKATTAYTLKIGHPVLGLTLSPDGAFLAALHQGSLNTEITIFDLASRQSRTIRGGAAFPAMALSSGGNFIALPDLDNAVHVKDTGNNATEYKLTHQQLAYAVALSEDGKFAASGSEDGTARVMETGTGRVIALIPTGSPVKSVVFTATNDLVLASSDKTVRTVNILKRPAFEALHVDGTIAISPRGRYLTTFSGTSTSELAIVDRVTGETRLRQPLPPDLVTTGVMRYSMDEEHLVVTGAAHGMTAYELKTGKTQHKPAPPDLTAQAISGDGRTVAWTSAKNIEVFRTDDSRQDRLEFSNTRVLELSADGQFVAAAGKDPTLSVFDVATKNKLFDVQLETSVKKAAFTPDGRYLVTSADNRNLILSDMRTRQALWRLNDAEASLLVFSHDGSILLTGGSGEGDSAFDVKLIETATGKTLLAVRNETQPLGAAFSIDGRYFDIVDDTSITRHYLRSEDLIEQTCKLLTRNLRQDEWNTFLPSKAYRQTCPL